MGWTCRTSPARGEAAPDRHGAARRLGVARRQGRRHQAGEAGVVFRPMGTQEPALLRQAVTLPEEVAGAVVRCQEATAPVQMDDADAGLVEEGAERRPQGLGAGQGAADVDVVADVRQQALDHAGLDGPPVRGDRVQNSPGKVRAVQAAQPHVEAVAGIGPGGEFIVCRAGLQRLWRVHLGGVSQPAFGQAPEAHNSVVLAMVVLPVIALQVVSPLTPEQAHGGAEAGVALGACGYQQGVALHADGLVDQLGGGGPQGVVEGGVVQRRQEALEEGSPGHVARSPRTGTGGLVPGRRQSYVDMETANIRLLGGIASPEGACGGRQGVDTTGSDEAESICWRGAAIQLEPGSGGFATGAVSPFLEMGAYDPPWLCLGTTFRSMAPSGQGRQIVDGIATATVSGQGRPCDKLCSLPAK